ncbi:MAG: hypothetical protein ACXWH0_14130 [Acidimicrobiia bacterium]
MADVIPTLLLLALPASGKSEVRRYLGSLTPERAADEFGLGRSIQLDDYPYVHLMRRISAELRHLYRSPVFFASEATPFLDPADWGTLIHLVSEDYADLAHGEESEPPSAAEWLLERMDRARGRVGLPPVLADVSDGEREILTLAVEQDARQFWVDRLEAMSSDRSGATVIIEFARGGPDAAAMPLERPFGYQYSLSLLSHEILTSASALYVWVTPEESRRRNQERARPGRAGDASILHHGVPELVMRQDYGTDDMMWLIEHADRPGTVRVDAGGRAYHLPVAVFDNREDKTSFLRADPPTWPAESVALLHAELKEAFRVLASA